MEVFIVSTPTYSGNYKANLEGLRVQLQRHARASYPHRVIYEKSPALPRILR
jgi:hypothetical protein